MNELKETVEHKQGQPWKVVKVCDDFGAAHQARLVLLNEVKDGTQVKVKFLPSTGKFVVKSRNPQDAVVEQKTEKKNKKARKQDSAT